MVGSEGGRGSGFLRTRGRLCSYRAIVMCLFSYPTFLRLIFQLMKRCSL